MAFEIKSTTKRAAEQAVALGLASSAQLEQLLTKPLSEAELARAAKLIDSTVPSMSRAQVAAAEKLLDALADEHERQQIGSARKEAVKPLVALKLIDAKAAERVAGGDFLSEVRLSVMIEKLEAKVAALGDGATKAKAELAALKEAAATLGNTLDSVNVGSFLATATSGVVASVLCILGLPALAAGGGAVMLLSLLFPSLVRHAAESQPAPGGA